MIKYCKNCKYFKRNKKDIHESICKAPQNVDEDIGDPYGYGGTGEFQPRVLNLKNKCKYYKKNNLPLPINPASPSKKPAILLRSGWWPLFKKKNK